ncbi:MAG: radical SAM protein, partial [Nanoarchaeota archaeon]|nr:radical SAM protein [Nanoarchaeota archaeon]
MAELEFENLEFEDKKDHLEVTLLRSFAFIISNDALNRIGQFRIKKKSIEFSGLPQKQAAAKFNLLIAEGIGNLRNRLNNKPAVYIHRNSGIPLIGSLFFGIVDRGTTILEIKPLTSCNMNCIFCSVDEGLSSRKETDFIVEEEYLVEELQRLLEFKKIPGIEIFINPHGEPLLYSDIVKLVKDMKKIRYIKKVSIATNGMMLTEKLVDGLAAAGLDQFNISVHSFDEKQSRMMAGTNDYNISKVKKMIEYIISKKIRIVLAPVWMPGVNDKDVEEIVIYCKKKGCETGIQKYIRHKKGRNPQKVKEMDW